MIEANTRQFLELEAKGAALTRIDSLPLARGSRNWYGVRLTVDEGWGEEIPTAIVTTGSESVALQPERSEGGLHEYLLPACALLSEHFSLSFFSGNLRTSLPLWISTRPSGYTEALTEPLDPPPSVYEQMTEQLADLKSAHAQDMAAANEVHEAMSARMDGMRASYDSLEERMDVIETGLSAILSEAEAILVDHETRIQGLETALASTEEALSEI